jgi:hypothetical protein
MSQRLTTAFGNAIATLIADTFSDGLLVLYSGVPGTTPEDVSSASVLCSILLPAVAFGVSANGVISMAGQWFGTVSASGTATWGRFSNRADTMHMVITVSGTGGTGELKLDHTAMTEGGVVDVASFSYTVPLS